MSARTRGGVAVVGAAYAGVGSSPGWTSLELLGRATTLALQDAGLSLSDVDGLCAATFYHFFPTLTVGEYLGIHPTWSNSDTVGGSSFLTQVAQAQLALEAHLCDVVLVAYGSTARSSRDLNGLIETPDLERPYRPLVPVSGYALAASRYLYQYRRRRHDLAAVALAARRWARLNPDAELRHETTIAELMAAPMIASPFSRWDCCLVSDGAAAIVLTRADRARHLRQPPCYVLGCAAAHWHREITQMPDFTTTAASESGPAAMRRAGVSHEDIDVLQLYDAFTLNPLLFLEDLGFCERGEAADFIAEGYTSPGGKLPVNTNGGGLCFAHPGAYGLFALIEAVTQLRGAANERQVPGAEIALVQGNGGTLSHQATMILGAGAAL